MPTPLADETLHKYNFTLTRSMREALKLACEKTGHGTIAALIRELLVEFIHEQDISLKDVKQFGVSKYRELQQQKAIVEEQNRAMRSELDRVRNDYNNLRTNMNNMISQGRY